MAANAFMPRLKRRVAYGQRGGRLRSAEPICSLHSRAGSFSACAIDWSYKKMATERRISFSTYDAAHLYELALEHFCISKDEGVCHVCLAVKIRLEKHIGKKEVDRIRRQTKKYPYS